jgi:hypothetical protein
MTAIDADGSNGTEASLEIAWNFNPNIKVVINGHFGPYDLVAIAGELPMPLQAKGTRSRRWCSRALEPVMDLVGLGDGR